MPDKEKVIKGLEELEGFLFKEYTNIKAEESKIYYDRFKSLSDAITLLKEQEAVEPSFKQDEKGIFVWCCGSCGAYMYHIYDGIDKAKKYAKFCRQCGKVVKWE